MSSSTTDPTTAVTSATIAGSGNVLVGLTAVGSWSPNPPTPWDAKTNMSKAITRARVRLPVAEPESERSCLFLITASALIRIVLIPINFGMTPVPNSAVLAFFW